jgi:16S rRNA processing protein RimM
MSERGIEPKKKDTGSGLVLLGRIAGAHGVQGEVRINSFTDPPENIAAYGTLTDSAGRRLIIERLRPLKNNAVAARIAGISDRNAAETLKDAHLYVARASLPEPDEDEWYYADLIGLAAVSPANEPIGEVVAVQNFGAGDLLEIRCPDERETRLLPFTKDAVPVIDVKCGHVVVVLPEEEEAEDDDDRD